MTFDEEVVRDISGVVFTGEPVSKVHSPILPFLIVHYRSNCDRMSG